MLATAAVVAVVVASVLVDLPTHTTVATDIADQISRHEADQLPPSPAAPTG